MPIAKVGTPSQQSSLVSDDLDLSSQGLPSRQIIQSPAEQDDDDYSDHPLTAYRRQKLEHERRKRRVQAAPDSWRGFLEWLHVCATDVTENEKFHVFILICICVNSIMLGVVTFPVIKDDPTLSRVFNIVDMIFLVIFTIDIVMQLFAIGFEYFKNGWCLFDLLVVLISWLSLSVTELYACRVFRAFRLITKVEVMRNVVVVIFHVVPALSGICFLLMLIMYIYSVLCTDLFKGYYPGVMSGDYFGRIDYSFFTLFQFICMDEWSSIAYELVEVKYWFWIIFITFIVMTAFVVVNLMIAVICDAVGILRMAEKALLYGSQPPEEFEVSEHDSEEQEEQNDLRAKIHEMEEMLDEMEVAQERMAETIKYLSLAILSRRT